MFTEFKRSLDFLDSLCRLGEEPYEIEFYVSETAALAVPLVAAEFERSGMVVPTEMIGTYMEDLFAHIYLNSEARSRSIRTLSTNSLKAYLEQLMGECGNRITTRLGIISFTEDVLSALDANQLIKGVAAKRTMLRSWSSSLEKEMEVSPSNPTIVH